MSSDDPIQVTTSLPIWAKVLIGFFVIGMLGAIGAIISGSYLAARWQETARDPRQVQQVIDSVMELELPKDFETVLAFEFRDNEVVQLAYKPDSTQFKFQKMDNLAKFTEKNFEANVAREPGAGTLKNTSRPEIQKVGGKDMTYTVGTNGLGLEEMRGMILLNDGRDYLRFSAYTPAKTLNKEAIQKLLSSIKSFH
jgi:hypothetical protein